MPYLMTPFLNAFLHSACSYQLTSFPKQKLGSPPCVKFNFGQSCHRTDCVCVCVCVCVCMCVCVCVCACVWWHDNRRVKMRNHCLIKQLLQLHDLMLNTVLY